MKSYSFSTKIGSDSKKVALARLLRKVATMLESSYIEGTPVQMEIQLITDKYHSDIGAVVCTKERS